MATLTLVALALIYKRSWNIYTGLKVCPMGQGRNIPQGTALVSYILSLEMFILPRHCFHDIYPKAKSPVRSQRLSPLPLSQPSRVCRAVTFLRPRIALTSP